MRKEARATAAASRTTPLVSPRAATSGPRADFAEGPILESASAASWRSVGLGSLSCSTHADSGLPYTLVPCRRPWCGDPAYRSARRTTAVAAVGHGALLPILPRPNPPNASRRDEGLLANAAAPSGSNYSAWSSPSWPLTGYRPDWGEKERPSGLGGEKRLRPTAGAARRGWGLPRRSGGAGLSAVGSGPGCGASLAAPPQGGGVARRRGDAAGRQDLGSAGGPAGNEQIRPASVCATRWPGCGGLAPAALPCYTYPWTIPARLRTPVRGGGTSPPGVLRMRTRRRAPRRRPTPTIARRPSRRPPPSPKQIRRLAIQWSESRPDEPDDPAEGTRSAPANWWTPAC